MAKGKIYFASDFHLGVDGLDNSKERERLVVKWLDEIAEDAEEIYLVGDLFDFWFEYKSVVPKGSFRFLAKLDELIQSGIKVFIFTGNHDMWMFGYLEEELGITIIRKPIKKQLLGKTFYIGHGDGLGPGDRKYKFLKKFFSSKICQWLFARLNPNYSYLKAKYWSSDTRKSDDAVAYSDPDKEWLIQYSLDYLKKEHIDYFVFGHRH